MQGRCKGLVLALVLCAPLSCAADELSGKLERVDLSTVTLRTTDNQQLVLGVNPGDRQRAAPYLGKSVMVQFRTEQGAKKLVLFRGCQFSQ
jgi:hypothetical protein